MATSGGGPRHIEEDDPMRTEAHPMGENPMVEKEMAAPTKAEEGAPMPKETPEVATPQAEATLVM